MIASRRVNIALQQADWNNTRLVKDHAAEEVEKLKREVEGNIFVFGSADL